MSVFQLIWVNDRHELETPARERSFCNLLPKLEKKDRMYARRER